MAQINILDSETIDKIAAGEVVERPASVVKELVENAIDAGATAVTVEVKDGGIEFIRVTDNGSGIEREQLQKAFLRHATSKIQNADDLVRVSSLGFRGEALSSISAVSKVEVITKTENSMVGSRICINGGVEQSIEEVGAPQGTTFLVRNLFYNTPVRRKFLKQPATEGGYIADLMEHMAISRPDISFKLVLGNQTRFHTSGSGDLKEVIYRIYGKEIASNLISLQAEREGIRVEGYLGKPVLVRSNRNYEIYFINGRFIKSTAVAKAIEEGYKEYLMQHKFPLCILHITMDTAKVDVNVHPTKMDVRFSDTIGFVGLLTELIRQGLKQTEMIPETKLVTEEKESVTLQNKPSKAPEIFETSRNAGYKVMEETRYHQEESFAKNPVWARIFKQNEPTENAETKENAEAKENTEELFFVEAEEDWKDKDTKKEEIIVDSSDQNRIQNQIEEILPEKETVSHEQMNLFEEKMLTVENRNRYKILGQIFDTYWLVQFEDKLYIIDQHAAHEKVKYERLMKHFQENQIVSQNIMPPVIVSLSGQEESILKEYETVFASMGFEIEAFGGNEYAIRSVPADLYGCKEKELFLEVLDDLAENGARGGNKTIEEKIATMSCKAAVKGNNTLSTAEADALIDELLTLDNPYHCPHGRPTIISMSKNEIEKKFKRIL